jgi:hypothetical protein
VICEQHWTFNSSCNNALRFVDNALKKKERRRLIRSHVMQGKTACRTYTSRKGTRPVQKKEQAVSLVTDLSRNVHGLKHTLGLRRLLWNDLSLISFAEQLDYHSMNLVHSCKSHPGTRLLIS